jgi:hypothetical protein
VSHTDAGVQELRLRAFEAAAPYSRSPPAIVALSYAIELLTPAQRRRLSALLEALPAWDYR